MNKRQSRNTKIYKRGSYIPTQGQALAESRLILKYTIPALMQVKRCSIVKLQI
jgi:hypothetical protein